MLFNLKSSLGCATHVGVLEFSAEEGCCYVPYWIMNNLSLEEGSLVTCTNVSLPKATAIKLKPQSVAFLEISNPRAVLEHALRGFSCVTKDDTLCIPYNGRNYHLKLMDVKPADAACIIETDCNVDFEKPEGYVEPDYKKMAEEKNKEVYGNMKKQSRFGGQSPGQPSPGLGPGAAGSIPDLDIGAGAAKGPTIVNGKIIGSNPPPPPTDSTLLASQVGATGIQPNAAIRKPAATLTYWAEAGGGSRLDGKRPSPLKTSAGDIVDARALREAAAQRRVEEAKEKGEEVGGQEVKRRKSRIGDKFSKRKTGAKAFGGGGNKL